MNPRGFTFAPDGALVVAESGAVPDGFEAPHGPPTPMFRPATTTTGRVSRIDLTTGQRTTLAEGLPSAASSFGDTLGPANVAYIGSDLLRPDLGRPDPRLAQLSLGRLQGESGRHRAAGRQPRRIQLEEPGRPLFRLTTSSAIRTTWSPGTARSGSPTATATSSTRSRRTATVSRVADLSQGHPVLTGIAAAPGRRDHHHRADRRTVRRRLRAGSCGSARRARRRRSPGRPRPPPVWRLAPTARSSWSSTRKSGEAAVPDAGHRSAGPPDRRRQARHGRSLGPMWPTIARIGPDGAVVRRQRQRGRRPRRGADRDGSTPPAACKRSGQEREPLRARMASACSTRSRGTSLKGSQRCVGTV